MLRLSLLLLWIAQAPTLQIDAPPTLASEKSRMEAIDRTRLDEVVRLMGLKNPGPPIQIELASAASELARAVDPWIAGFAQQDKVVIFPSRSPSYPDRTIDDVLRHEVAHALIWRASAGRPVPRWFNEGLAMAAERPRFRDQTQLFLQLASGSTVSFHELDRLFDGGKTDQSRAYLLSRAVVRDLLNKHGEDSGGRILDQMGRGASFETAFRDIIGTSTTTAEGNFWNSQRAWTTWLSILSSQETLWMAITILAILAIWRKRRRAAALRKQWDEEEALEQAALQHDERDGEID